MTLTTAHPTTGNGCASTRSCLCTYGGAGRPESKALNCKSNQRPRRTLPPVQIRIRALGEGNAPKMMLHTYCTKAGLPQPVYTTEETPVTRVFRVRVRAGPRSCERWLLTSVCFVCTRVCARNKTTVEVDGRRYGTTNWHKSKKVAEHAAAVAAIGLARLPVPLGPDLLDQPLDIPPTETNPGTTDVHTADAVAAAS